MRQGRRPVVLDVPTLFRLWNDATLRVEEIAVAMGVTTSTLRKVAARHGLLHRDPPPQTCEFIEAPSPAEDLLSQDSLALSPWVAARARECRERHYAQRRRESEDATIARAYRNLQGAG